MKNKIYKILFMISIVLVILFGIIIINDYIHYDSLINSAPFSALIIVRFIEFIVPSIITFIIGIVLKK